jgi:hypothetical protein
VAVISHFRIYKLCTVRSVDKRWNTLWSDVIRIYQNLERFSLISYDKLRRSPNRNRFLYYALFPRPTLFIKGFCAANASSMVRVARDAESPDLAIVLLSGKAACIICVEYPVNSGRLGYLS